MPRRALFLITVLVLALHWLVLSGVPLAWDNPGSPVGKVFRTRSIAAPPPPAAAVAAVAAVAPRAAEPAGGPQRPARPRPPRRHPPRPPPPRPPPPARRQVQTSRWPPPPKLSRPLWRKRSPQRQPPPHRHQPRQHQPLSPRKPQQAWTSPRPGLARTTRPARPPRLCACLRPHGWRLT